MEDLDLEAYLARIGYAGPLDVQTAVLRDLHEHHVTAVPFENLDILLGRPILLDLPALQRKLVGARRGGYCFEQNTLFQAVLVRLGFAVTPLAARVRLGATEIRPRTHMCGLVETPDGRFLADVGFGAGGPFRPVPFPGGGDGFTFRAEGDQWVLCGGGAASAADVQDLYAFGLEPQFAVDFAMASHYTSTWPSSAFVQTLTAQRTTAAGSAILRNRELVLRAGDRTTTLAVQDPDHLLALLAQHFGLKFPPGTRFSRPDF